MKFTTLAIAVLAGVLGGGVVIMVDSMTNQNPPPQTVLDAGTVQGNLDASFKEADEAGVNASFLVEEENQFIEELLELVCEE